MKTISEIREFCRKQIEQDAKKQYTAVKLKAIADSYGDDDELTFCIFDVMDIWAMAAFKGIDVSKEEAEQILIEVHNKKRAKVSKTYEVEIYKQLRKLRKSKK